MDLTTHKQTYLPTHIHAKYMQTLHQYMQTHNSCTYIIQSYLFAYMCLYESIHAYIHAGIFLPSNEYRGSRMQARASSPKDGHGSFDEAVCEQIELLQEPHNACESQKGGVVNVIDTLPTQTRLASACFCEHRRSEVAASYG